MSFANNHEENFVKTCRRWLRAAFTFARRLVVFRFWGAVKPELMQINARFYLSILVIKFAAVNCSAPLVSRARRKEKSSRA